MPLTLILLLISVFSDFSIAIGREGGVAPLIALARSVVEVSHVASAQVMNHDENTNLK